MNDRLKARRASRPLRAAPDSARHAWRAWVLTLAILLFAVASAWWHLHQRSEATRGGQPPTDAIGTEQSLEGEEQLAQLGGLSLDDAQIRTEFNTD